ncbi:MAG TPA: hypothetical protein P5217_05240 [Methanoregulaceae archaeon]|nr:hypothetical protein [Methanoregulaceae archaeon]HPD75043.1 hypothetical protein [Methanoregulaceae archaeon]HRY75668.1 hypothetical protein [Methanoregulaceae archaeon]
MEWPPAQANSLEKWRGKDAEKGPGYCAPLKILALILKYCDYEYATSA